MVGGAGVGKTVSYVGNPSWNDIRLIKVYQFLQVLGNEQEKVMNYGGGLMKTNYLKRLLWFLGIFIKMHAVRFRTAWSAIYTC